MFSHFLALRSNRPPATAGFSLVELMVSIGIIVLVLSIVVTQQGAFNSAVLLRSQAYEIALTIREAQLSAVSAINDPSGGSENFRRVIGVHFDTSDATDQRYILFVDSNNDNFYTSGEEFGGPQLLDPRFEISGMTPSTGAITGTDLSVVFERPNFDANFFEGPNNPQNSQSILIDIRPRGVTTGSCPEDLRQIEVTSTGQVAVVEC